MNSKRFEGCFRDFIVASNLFFFFHTFIFCSSAHQPIHPSAHSPICPSTLLIPHPFTIYPSTTHPFTTQVLQVTLSSIDHVICVSHTRCPPIHLLIHIFFHPSIYSSIHPSTHPSIFSSIHLLIHPSIHLLIHLSFHPSIYSFIHPSFIHFLSIVYLIIHPSLALHLSICSSIVRSLTQPLNHFFIF